MVFNHDPPCSCSIQPTKAHLSQIQGFNPSKYRDCSFLFAHSYLSWKKIPESQDFTIQLLVFCGIQGHRSLTSGNTPTNNPAVIQRQERQGLGPGLSHALRRCSAGKTARFLLLIKSSSCCLCPCPQCGTQAIVYTY